MSDDLISRKDLLGTESLLMTDVVKNNKVARYILEQVLYDIEHTPTAFGKEKVVKEIKEKYEHAAHWETIKGICEIIEKGGLTDRGGMYRAYGRRMGG